MIIIFCYWLYNILICFKVRIKVKNITSKSNTNRNTVKWLVFIWLNLYLLQNSYGSIMFKLIKSKMQNKFKENINLNDRKSFHFVFFHTNWKMNSFFTYSLYKLHFSFITCIGNSFFAKNNLVSIKKFITKTVDKWWEIAWKISCLEKKKILLLNFILSTVIN